MKPVRSHVPFRHRKESWHTLIVSQLRPEFIALHRGAGNHRHGGIFCHGRMPQSRDYEQHRDFLSPDCFASQRHACADGGIAQVIRTAPTERERLALFGLVVRQYSADIHARAQMRRLPGGRPCRIWRHLARPPPHRRMPHEAYASPRPFQTPQGGELAHAWP